MKTYILQQDIITPSCSIAAGVEFIEDKYGCRFGDYQVPEVYLKDKKWFKLKEEKIIVDKFNKEPDNWYRFHLTNGGWLSSKRILSAQKAIEFIVKYTEEDMRKCFEAGFELSKDYSKTPTPFEDYIKSIP